MNQRLSLFLFLALAALPSNAFAYLPVSAITQFVASVYGFYASQDPTCQTGLVAVLPLSNTPVAANIAANPSLGTSQNPLPNTVACLVVVLKNSGGPVVIAPGTYTGMTQNGANTYSDNIPACNNGGTLVPANTIFVNQGQTMSWPTKIQQDAAALNPPPTLLTTAPSGTATGNEYIPFYYSTYSKCTGNIVADASAAGCVSGTNPVPNPYLPPTAPADFNHGNLLVSPASGGSIYRFFVDFSQSIGATGPSTCGLAQPALHGFEVIQ
jgi:hypothetical protein